MNQALVPRPQPPMERAALLAVVAQAASAAAIGSDDSQAQRTLDGRQFELRIRFGCRGPATDLRRSWLGWMRDEKSGTLRVRAQPTLSAEDALIRQLGGGDYEEVEGFWVPRPWLHEPACPKDAALLPRLVEDANMTLAQTEARAAGPDQPEPAADPVPKGPRIGIAHFFAESDPRTKRRSSRAYEAVKTIDPAQPLGAQGFNLVLSGRLQALPNGRVILCAAANADTAPECVISAEFDKVRIERPDTGELVAEWGGG